MVTLKEFPIRKFDESLIDHAFYYNLDLPAFMDFNDRMIDGYKESSNKSLETK